MIKYLVLRRYDTIPRSGHERRLQSRGNDIEPDITAQLDMATQSETIEETSADEVEKEVERNVSSKMKILNSGIDCGHPRQSPTRRS